MVLYVRLQPVGSYLWTTAEKQYSMRHAPAFPLGTEECKRCTPEDTIAMDGECLLRLRHDRHGASASQPASNRTIDHYMRKPCYF